MAIQEIDIGTTANDGTGDTVREAFDKVNDNFTELYAFKKIVLGQHIKTLTASEIFGKWVVPIETTFRAGLPNSGGKIGTNFGSNVTLSILDETDTPVGTVNVSSVGVFTFTFADEVVIPALGSITIMQPADVLAGENLTITLVGDLTGTFA